MQGYLNLKAYWEFDAANRAAGWNSWVDAGDFACTSKPRAASANSEKIAATLVKMSAIFTVHLVVFWQILFLERLRRRQRGCVY
jgi:hypothetical protein